MGDVRVSVAARYLGAAVGTDTRGPQWGAVAPKLEDRARDVAACGASLPTRLQLFNICCGGMVRYRAQFAAPDLDLAAAYRVAAQKVCAALWMAFAPTILNGAALLFGGASTTPAETRPHSLCWAHDGYAANGTHTTV